MTPPMLWPMMVFRTSGGTGAERGQQGALSTSRRERSCPQRPERTLNHTASGGLSAASCAGVGGWAGLTDLPTRALVVEGTEGDGGEEDGDVEEDGRGHVLQQGLITANDTWGGTKGEESPSL